jgi:N-acetylmuramoyl-L-alanine amidase
MDMKKIPAIVFIIFFSSVIYGNGSASGQDIGSERIRYILSAEKDSAKAADIAAISERMDRIYANLYNKLIGGKKIRIFMDPVHGKVKTPDGGYDWQGSLTWRKSTTGNPEELYSIPITRLFYKKLIDNGHFEVASTDDYLEMMKGKTDSYLDISFDDTYRFADKSDSFLIISEHLNNVSPVNKADGFVNLNGIHLTCTERRTPLLSYINGIYHGYLTFNNQYDATGVSYFIAEGFREKMKELGHEPNAWEHGIVPYGTFTHFVNFPIAVIYESGFISNPEEEKLLRDETYQETIAECQFEGMLSAIEKGFGVDVSGSTPVKKSETDPLLIDIIKIERIICYYVQRGDFRKALDCIGYFEKTCAGTKYAKMTATYTAQKGRITDVMNARAAGNAYLKKKKYSQAYKSFQKAVRTMGYHGLFNEIREIIYAESNIAARALGKREIHYYYPTMMQQEVYPADLSHLRANIETHPIGTPYLITINDGQSLEDAVDSSIAPSNDQRAKIISALKNGTVNRSIYKKVYSSKSKKYVYRRTTVKTRPEFFPGIYIVSFDGKLGLKNVTRTNSVPFDPMRYQNQLFFKNSCLAERVKEKAL